MNKTHHYTPAYRQLAQAREFAHRLARIVSVLAVASAIIAHPVRGVTAEPAATVASTEAAAPSLRTQMGHSHGSSGIAVVPGPGGALVATQDDVGVIKFYLVPQEMAADPVASEIARTTAISTEELADWLHDIDAGDITLVIDACHSAAAVQTAGFKPGPMGDKGLGQLAYDKGIRILAATQADDVALDGGSLQHGLLTFALVNEGLDAHKADFKPVDRTIDLIEWMQYATARVPEIHHDIQSGRRGLNYQGKAWPLGGRGLAVRPGTVKAKQQKPALFDFTRRSAPPPELCLLNLPSKRR